jgi:hypothetical protein
MLAGAWKIALRLLAVAHRDSGKNESGNALFEAPRHAEADRAQARNSHGKPSIKSFIRSRVRHYWSPALAAERVAG